jgi:hypothetical protein
MGSKGWRKLFKNDLEKKKTHTKKRGGKGEVKDEVTKCVKRIRERNQRKGEQLDIERKKMKINEQSERRHTDKERERDKEKKQRGTV